MGKLLTLFSLMLWAPVVLAVPISYQGQLQDQAGPFTGIADMEFQLFASLLDDDAVGDPISKEGVPVSDGLFQVELDFGPVFGSDPLYLSISVDGEVLTPRQQITAAPVARYALSAPGSSVWESQDDGVAYATDGLALSFLPAPDIEDGPVILMGHPANEAASGATVSGGGSAAQPNRATGTYASVSGGRENWASGFGATIPGGEENRATVTSATVGGGLRNQATGVRSTVSGGFVNQALGTAAAAGGGSGNRAQGDNATVPGGLNNQALGNYSFAAGRRARAAQDGAFVWADSTDADFASTGEDQFLIRASGGVGINTNDPNGFDLAVGGHAAKPGGGSWTTFSDARLKRNIQPVSEGPESLLERLLALNAYSFEYTRDAVDTRLGLPGRQIGLLAQEVKDVFPEWVGSDENGYFYVTERGTTAIMVEALRELRDSQDRQLAELRSENGELRRQVAANSQLAERNAELEQRLAALESLLLDDRAVAVGQ